MLCLLNLIVYVGVNSKDEMNGGGLSVVCVIFFITVVFDASVLNEDEAIV